jgi:hypothetical protein
VTQSLSAPLGLLTFVWAVGPSSSHTVGPMRAGKIFIADLKDLELLEKVGLPFLFLSVIEIFGLYTNYDAGLGQDH